MNPARRGVISLRYFNDRVLSHEHVLRIYRDREALGILSIRFFRNARRTFFGVRRAHRRTLDFGSGGGDESAFFRLLEPRRRFGARTRPKNGTASEFRWQNRHRRHSEPFVQSNRRMRPVRDLSLVRYRSRGALSHSDGGHLGLRGEIRKRMGRRFQARKRVDLQCPVRRFGGSLLPELPMNGKFPRVRRTTGRERDRLVGFDGLFDRHVSQLRRILLLLQLLTAPFYGRIRKKRLERSANLIVSRFVHCLGLVRNLVCQRRLGRAAERRNDAFVGGMERHRFASERHCRNHYRKRRRYGRRPILSAYGETRRERQRPRFRRVRLNLRDGVQRPFVREARTPPFVRRDRLSFAKPSALRPHEKYRKNRIPALRARRGF